MGSKRTHLADEPIKRARFYRNGDIHFSGVDIAISKKRFKSFDSLLNELTYKVSLPCGVRHISTPGGVHQIEKLDEINDGDKYVCSTYRSIKKLDYLGIMDSKPAWAASSTKPKYFSKHSYHESVVSKPGNFQPKPITVIAKNDSKNRAKIVLTKKVAMCYESLLRVIDETLQMSTGCVKDLYTLQGKKVESINDIICGPDTYVAQGRIPVRARSLPSHSTKGSKSGSIKGSRSSEPPKKKSNKSAKFQVGQAYLKKEKKTKKKQKADNTPKQCEDQYIVTIKTCDELDAGTDSKVSMVVYGSKGCTDELAIGPPKSEKFKPGSTEEFQVSVSDIGKIYKIRVGLDDSGKEHGWHVEEIIMTNTSKSEEVCFKCDKWLSEDKEDGEVTREFPALVDGEPIYPVFTGDVFMGGTDSEVYITIVGENGDTGKRILNKPLNESDQPFSQGSNADFQLEAVNLGKLSNIIIGHDNRGGFPGWFLDKVIIRDEEKEYAFPCRRSHYKEKSSVPEIKGAANQQMNHIDELKIQNLDLRGLMRDKKSEGSDRFFRG